MGTALFTPASDTIIELCTRAVIASAIILIFLIILTNAIHKNHHARQVIFLVIVSVIAITSAILCTAAYVRLQEVTIVAKPGESQAV